MIPCVFLCPWRPPGVLFSAGALAEPLNYNQIQLGADARREINNDTLNAVLFTETTASPAQLSAVLNERMAAALKIASQHGGSKTSSGQLSTWPVYDNNQRASPAGAAAPGCAWKAATLNKPRSTDWPVAKPAQIAQVGFTVSDRARRKVESELIPQAIGAFRDKARLVKMQALGGRDYRLVGNARGSGPASRACRCFAPSAR